MIRVGVVLIFAILVSVFWFGFSDTAEQKEKQRSSLNTVVQSIPDHLDATRSLSYNMVSIVDNLFFRLFRVNMKMQFEGEIAASWDVDEKSKYMTIKMNKEFLFVGGEKLTASDVVKSFERVSAPESLVSSFFGNIKAIEKIDDFSIGVKFSGWSHAALSQLASPFFAVYRNGRAPVRSDETSWTGTSKYRIKDWSPERMTVVNHSGREISLLALGPFLKDENRQVDFLVSRLNWLSRSQIEELRHRSKGSFVEYEFDSLNTSLLFQNRLVSKEHRRCLSLKSLEVDLLTANGMIDRTKSVLPRGMFSYSEPKPVRVERPKKVIEMVLLASRQSDDFSSILNHLQKVFKYCRVLVGIENVDRKEYMRRLFDRDFDLALVTISVLYNDPYFVFSFFSRDSKFNFSGSSEVVARRVEEFRASESRAEALYRSEKLQASIVNEGLAVPLVTISSRSFLRSPLIMQKFGAFDVILWENIR